MRWLTWFKSARGLATAGMVALVAAGCGGWYAAPAPEARAAADQIAYEIDTYRGEPAVAPQTDVTLFARVYDRVRQDYVREVDDAVLVRAAVDGMHDAYPDPDTASDRQLVEAAIQSMLQSLDPHSVYLDQAAYMATRQVTKGSFGGLGVEVTKTDDAIQVVSPLDDTPASRAGLASGDLITHADGRSLAGLSLSDSVFLLRGEPGSPITLTIARKDQVPFDVTIIREIIRVQAVRWRQEGDIGYVRISGFSRNVAGELRDAIESLETEIGPRLEGFVIDLRSNPGGLLDQSVEVSDLFLEEGLIVYTRGRSDSMDFFARRGDVAGGKPLVILIDGGSASASEIVAGALQDQGRAVLVGTKSFGKGSVQTLFPLGEGDGLKLTVALYYTPSGRTVDGGIAPDLAVELNPDREGDEQLEVAFDTLRRLAGSGPKVGMAPTNDNAPKATVSGGIGVSSGVGGN